jgi:hypothetical protein
MPLRRITMPGAVKVLGIIATCRALRFGAAPLRHSTAMRSSAETELTVEPIAVTTEGEYSANEMAGDEVVEKAERFRAINAKDMEKWADKYPRLKENLQDIKRSALIFPFKASPYLVDELIDWEMEGDIKLDPFYKLVFPTLAMLDQHHQDDLNAVCDAGDPKEIKAAIERIREDLNPHPAGQKTLNAPKKAELTGVKHKNAETDLSSPPRRRRATPTAPTASAGRSSSATPTSASRRRTPTRSSTTSRTTPRSRTSSSRAATP